MLFVDHSGRLNHFHQDPTVIIIIIIDSPQESLHTMWFLCCFLLTAVLKLIYPLARSRTHRNWCQIVVQTSIICKGDLNHQKRHTNYEMFHNGEWPELVYGIFMVKIVNAWWILLSYASAKVIIPINNLDIYRNNKIATRICSPFWLRLVVCLMDYGCVDTC